MPFLRPTTQPRHDFVAPCLDVRTRTYRAWIASGRSEAVAQARADRAFVACRAGLPTAAPNAAAPAVLPLAGLGDYPSYPTVDVPAVPTPRLSHYLDFWESERGAAQSLETPAWKSTPYHAEWDINVPVPLPTFFAPGGRNFLSFAGLEVQSRELRAWSAGSGLATVGQPIGQDPTALVNRQAGIMYVSATWAQRAANASRALIAGMLPIAVDGVVGSQTINALRLAQLFRYAQQTGTVMQSDTGQTSIGGVPLPTRSGSGVALAVDFGNYLASLTQVADPPAAPRPTTPAPTAPTAPPPTPPPSPAPESSGSSGGLYLLAALGIGVFAFSRR